MNHQTRILLGLAGGAITLGLLACRLFTITPTPERPVSVEDLRFSDTDTGRRFRALNEYIGKTFTSGWRTSGYQLIGNFYQSDWCSGQGASEDCQVTYGTQDWRNQHAISLYTLFYPQEYPQVFGLGLSAYQVPAGKGWGAGFYFSENGKTIVGSGWGADFRQYLTDSDPADHVVSIGDAYTYTIYGPHQTDFSQVSDLPLRDDLARYLSGPEALRDLALENLSALDTKVESALKDHQVQGCDLGPYQGNGVPPVCHLRPLTAAEEADELKKAQDYFAEQKQLVSKNYAEMYAAWMEAFPLDQFWP